MGMLYQLSYPGTDTDDSSSRILPELFSLLNKKAQVDPLEPREVPHKGGVYEGELSPDESRWVGHLLPHGVVE